MGHIFTSAVTCLAFQKSGNGEQIKTALRQHLMPRWSCSFVQDYCHAIQIWLPNILSRFNDHQTPVRPNSRIDSIFIHCQRPWKLNAKKFSGTRGPCWY